MTFPRQILYIDKILNYLSFSNLEDNKNVIKKFQKVFFNNFKTRKVLPLSFGRFGIYLACKQSILKNKKEVILSPFTIFDLVNMVILSGSKPVFCDIAENSNHITLGELKKKVTKNTSCLILTHYETLNPELELIYNFCKKKKIKLINDLAISIDSKLNNKYLYNFSDFTVYSFGFYKFVSTLQGGALYIKNEKSYNILKKEIINFKQYKNYDLYGKFFKYFIIKFFLNSLIFNIITFPIFRFAFIFNIKSILQFTKNDPNPFLRRSINNGFFKLLNISQVNCIKYSLKLLENKRRLRKKNFNIYRLYLKKYKILLDYDENSQHGSSFINCSILVNDKKKMSSYLMKNGFDISQYFYRDCSSINIFKKYNKSIYNAKSHVKKLIVLPTHHQLTKNYIIKLCNTIEKYYEKK